MLLTSVTLLDKCLGHQSTIKQVRIRNFMVSHIFLTHNVTSNTHKNNSVFTWWWYQCIKFVDFFCCDERKTEELVPVLNEEPRHEII